MQRLGRRLQRLPVAELLQAQQRTLLPHVDLVLVGHAVARAVVDSTRVDVERAPIVALLLGDDGVARACALGKRKLVDFLHHRHLGDVAVEHDQLPPHVRHRRKRRRARLLGRDGPYGRCCRLLPGLAVASGAGNVGGHGRHLQQLLEREDAQVERRGVVAGVADDLGAHGALDVLVAQLDAKQARDERWEVLLRQREHLRDQPADFAPAVLVQLGLQHTRVEAAEHELCHLRILQRQRLQRQQHLAVLDFDVRQLAQAVLAVHGHLLLPLLHAQPLHGLVALPLELGLADLCVGRCVVARFGVPPAHDEVPRLGLRVRALCQAVRAAARRRSAAAGGRADGEVQRRRLRRPRQVEQRPARLHRAHRARHGLREREVVELRRPHAVGVHHAEVVVRLFLRRLLRQRKHGHHRHGLVVPRQVERALGVLERFVVLRPGHGLLVEVLAGLGRL
eukprot:Unigene9084_Nuclearia_a/m.27780 Unigene9084_Nuclearia_a/g.27780  ORF Unigene9084_Nuclearia_a/g.27780 Unigene9084_Nuclearia_a/m.27780 type:complete len:451 (-) Unigene9084_Nuclearia_a:1663-3015(-)